MAKGQISLEGNPYWLPPAGVPNPPRQGRGPYGLLQRVMQFANTYSGGAPVDWRSIAGSLKPKLAPAAPAGGAPGTLTRDTTPGLLYAQPSRSAPVYSRPTEARTSSAPGVLPGIDQFTQDQASPRRPSLPSFEQQPMTPGPRAQGFAGNYLNGNP